MEDFARETVLTHRGLIWIARKTESDGEKFTGTTPEVAIRKLWAQYPELNNSSISYQIPRLQVGRAAVIRDLDHCPECGKAVIYGKGIRPNGWIGAMVWHEGEVPSDAEVGVDIQKEYKKELLRKLHKQIGVADNTPTLLPDNDNGREDDQVTTSFMNPVEPAQGLAASPIVPQSPIVPLKPKVVIPARTGNPDLPADRPVVDITGMKHNRFAVVGHIIKELREKYPDKIESIRSDLVNNSHNMPELFRTAEQYAIIHENGLPIHMESGL
jgi:hypothetical protein